jgi:hypothetical protein
VYLQADNDDSSNGDVASGHGSAASSLGVDGVRTKGCFPNSIRSLFGLSKKNNKIKRKNSKDHEVRVMLW